jgi:ribonuclease HI
MSRPISYTINSDASVDAKTLTAAYAYYIRGEDLFRRASGILALKTKHTGVAELLAIRLAITRVMEFDHDPHDVTLHINTDSMWAINALLGGKVKATEWALVKAVQHMLKGYELIPRHVKAHKHTNDARHWVNDWCDNAAKTALRAELTT